MLAEALRAPVADRSGRDAVAICTGLVVAGLVILRVARIVWPDALVVAPLLALVVPAAALLGYLGRVLESDSGTDLPAFEWSLRGLWLGGRLLVLMGVYLSPALVAIVVAAFILVEGGGAGGPLLTIVPTVALLSTVATLYLLPAALAATVHGGVRAGLQRSSLGGLASGSYFFAWTVGTALVVGSWSLLTAARTATVGALVGAVVFAYGHLAAAYLLREGLARSRWEP